MSDLKNISQNDFSVVESSNSRRIKNFKDQKNGPLEILSSKPDTSSEKEFARGLDRLSVQENHNHIKSENRNEYHILKPNRTNKMYNNQKYKSPHRTDCDSWRRPPDIEPPEYKPPMHVLIELEKDFIFPLKKKSLRFTKAKYFCRLCEYHCDTVFICRQHTRSGRHISLKEMKMVDYCLKDLPFPSTVQLDVITDVLERVALDVLITDEQYKQRMMVVSELETRLQTLVPDASLTINGSLLSGLAMKWSNIDIDIVVPPNMKSSSVLLATQKILNSYDTYEGVVNDLNSNYPNLSFTHKSTKFKVVVGITTLAAQNTNKLLGHYKSLDPRVKILVGCFKSWAMCCHIDNQKDGSLPSHALTLMVVHFLQQVEPAVLPCLHDLKPTLDTRAYLDPSDMEIPWKSKNKEGIGSLWIKLFRYYSIELSWQNVVNVRFKKPYMKGKSGKRLIIEDPFLTKRNLVNTISSTQVLEYIVSCLNTTYKYFAVPQLNFGPLYKLLHRRARVIETEKEEHSISKTTQDDLNGSISEDELDSDQDDPEEESLINETDEETKEPEMNGSISEASSAVFVSSKEETEEECSICNGAEPPTAVENVYHTLEKICLCVAKKYSKHLTKQLLFYFFKEKNFTAGLKLPIFCSVCQKNGHTKSHCMEYELPPLIPLPPKKDLPSYYSILSQIFYDLKAQCEPIYEEVKHRNKIVSELESYIQGFYPNAQLKLFGSSSNGFGFSNSDLDICLSFEGNETGAGLDFINIIKSLAKKLKKFHLCNHVLAITTAKVPIIKFFIMTNRVQVEADLSLYNMLAIQNTALLNTYANIDERVKVLGYGIKYFAKLCNIGDASRGSLSSYAYTLIVIHYLQQCKVIPVLQELYQGDEAPTLMIDGWNAWFHSDLENLSNVWKGYGVNKQTVGELWIGMLRYYTEVFDWTNHVITIRQFAPLHRLDKMWTTRCIAIEDPFDLGHNLGAGLSRKMNTFIMKSFIRGREVFGFARGDMIPPGLRNLVNYLFDKRKLTDGSPPNDRGCRFCGKIGHRVKDCPRKRPHGDRKDKNSSVNGDDDDDSRSPSPTLAATEEEEESNEPKFGRGEAARDQLLDSLPKDTARNLKKEPTRASSPKEKKKTTPISNPSLNISSMPSTPIQNKVLFASANVNTPSNAVSNTKTPSNLKTIDPNTLFQMANRLGGGTIGLSGGLLPPSFGSPQTHPKSIVSTTPNYSPLNQKQVICDKTATPVPPPGFSQHQTPSKENLFSIKAMHPGIASPSVSSSAFNVSPEANRSLVSNLYSTLGILPLERNPLPQVQTPFTSAGTGIENSPYGITQPVNIPNKNLTYVNSLQGDNSLIRQNASILSAQIHPSQIPNQSNAIIYHPSRQLSQQYASANTLPSLPQNTQNISDLQIQRPLGMPLTQNDYLSQLMSKTVGNPTVLPPPGMTASPDTSIWPQMTSCIMQNKTSVQNVQQHQLQTSPLNNSILRSTPPTFETDIFSRSPLGPLFPSDIPPRMAAQSPGHSLPLGMPASVPSQDPTEYLEKLLFSDKH